VFFEPVNAERAESRGFPGCSQAVQEFRPAALRRIQPHGRVANGAKQPRDDSLAFTRLN
jgi:hypothetical protein